MNNKISLFHYLLCVASGALLVLAFPLAELWLLAWVGLIPLFFALEGKNKKQSFGLGFLCGMVFFSGTLYWLFNITQWFSVIAGVGVIFLIFYLSLYFGLFALAAHYVQTKNSLIKIVALSSAWVVCEFIRANLFSGFSWVSLGLSQYKFLPIIQIADLTGMYGISFLIVLVNASIKEVLSASWRNKIVSVVCAGSLVFLVFHYGKAICQEEEGKTCSWDIAVVQANISQEDKWNHDLIEDNLIEHMDLFKEAIAAGEVDLVVWPETALPGVMDENHVLPQGFDDFLAEVNTPLLSGIVIVEGQNYYNAATVLSPEAQVKEIYRKIHLVPFGEFVPLRKEIPLLDALIPIDDFSEGEELTVFSLASKEAAGSPILYSALICFEDAVPSLVRGFVNQGAQFLVNMTNDGWFGDSAAPFLHLQSSVLRAVENRRSVIRAANTGISGYINEKGMIQGLVENDQGKATYVRGYSLFSLCGNQEKTFYTKHGDVFAYLCFGCILLFVGINKYINRRS